jgi:hypothetical protein
MTGGMRDADVRKALHAGVLAQHHGSPDTLVVEELGLVYGDARIDVAVINGEMHGYEIKSDLDTLRRLPHQAAIYGRVLDRITLVVGERHLVQATQAVPSWWGLLRATPVKNKRRVRLTPIRPAELNDAVDAERVAGLLWRNEALALLEEAGAAVGYRSKPRADLYRRLAEALPTAALKARVRAALKARVGWRAV